MNHFKGQAITNVRTSMNSNASGFGSFFSDGTTLYLVASDNSNPNTNGKTYLRSRFRREGGSAIYATAPNMALLGLDIRKTCLARPTDSDPYNAYAIQGDGGWGGTSLVQDCYAAYTSKHAIGFTENGSNRTTTINRCTAEQGTPYSSQSPFVDYNGNASATGNVSIWTNCVNLSPSGKLGSSTGSPIGGGTPTYLSHNNGVGTQFSLISFDQCTFGGSIGGGPAARATISNSTAYSADFGCESGLITNCVFRGKPPGAGNRPSTLVVRNCLITFNDAVLNNVSASNVGSNITLEGNTFDMRNHVSSDYAKWPMYVRWGSGPVNMTFRNNLVIVPAGKQFAVLHNMTSSDTLNFSNNAYVLGTSGTIATNYNDGSTTADRTFEEWQALGKDVDSFRTTATASINGAYAPLPGGPLINRGINIGPVSDFAGTSLFNPRNDIGAFEVPHTPVESWRMQHFGSSVNEGQGADTAVNAGDGLPNLLKYALGLDPLVPGVAPIITAISIDRLRLTAQKNPSATDVNYIVEVSGDLTSSANWTTVGVTTEIDTESQLRALDHVPVSESGARFLRLRVSRK
jgi:hypothetical protein